MNKENSVLEKFNFHFAVPNIDSSLISFSGRWKIVGKMFPPNVARTAGAMLLSLSGEKLVLIALGFFYESH